MLPRAGSGVERRDPHRFLAGCRERQPNQALSVLSLSTGFLNVLLLFIRVTFCVKFGLHLYVFCLLVVLLKLSVLAKWLARKTPLRKSLHGKETISTKPRPMSAYDFFPFCVLFHCFIVCLSCLPVHNIFHTPMTRYSLLVITVKPINQPAAGATAAATICGSNRSPCVISCSNRYFDCANLSQWTAKWRHC